MGTIDLPKDPHALYPGKTIPDVQQMVDGILAEETDRIVQHLGDRLPEDAFARLGADGSLREKLLGFLDAQFQKISSRYWEASDAGSSQYTPEEISELLISFGGAREFNAGEIETDERQGLAGLEHYTSHLLQQKNEAGTFLSADASYTVVKCSFRDNALKPTTVTDVKLCINIPDAEIISPAFRYLAIASHIIKDLISPNVIAGIDHAVESMEMGYFDVAAFLEISGYDTENQLHFDHIDEAINENPDNEAIRLLGFNRAAHALTALLDFAGLSYQFIENLAGKYQLIIREYDDTNPASLPDEYFEIRLSLYDNARLRDDRKAYNEQIKDFEGRVLHLGKLVDVIYRDSKSIFKVNDFEDLARKNRSRIKLLLKEQGLKEPGFKEQALKEKIGSPGESSSGDILFEKDTVRSYLARMQERINNMYDFLYPIERRVMEERLFQMESEYARIDRMTDPYQLQPGLVLEVDMTSIKRKKTTINSIAAVLKEFLTVPGTELPQKS